MHPQKQMTSTIAATNYSRVFVLSQKLPLGYKSHVVSALQTTELFHNRYASGIEMKLSFEDL